jgi:2-dehydro-3-deoxygluconokinase
MITNIITIGEALAVFRSQPGQPLWRTEQVSVGTGGAEANVAMTLAHRGVPVTWAGRVGDDSLGRRVIRELRAEGVSVAALLDDTRPTGLLVKDARSDGRTVVSYYRSESAGSALSPQDIDQLRLPLAPDTLVHLTGITAALSSSACAAVHHLVDLAHHAGALVSFDVNHRPRLWGTRSASAAHHSLARRANLVFASIDEVDFLINDTGPRPRLTEVDSLNSAVTAIGALRTEGYDHIVVTAGAAGSAAGQDGEVLSMPALRDIDVVDSVGAGDAFVGGYLASWARGGALSERLLMASVSGAAACRNEGDWEGATDLSGLNDGHEGGRDPVVR